MTATQLTCKINVETMSQSNYYCVSDRFLFHPARVALHKTVTDTACDMIERETKLADNWDWRLQHILHAIEKNQIHCFLALASEFDQNPFTPVF